VSDKLLAEERKRKKNNNNKNNNNNNNNIIFNLECTSAHPMGNSCAVSLQSDKEICLNFMVTMATVAILTNFKY